MLFGGSGIERLREWRLRRQWMRFEGPLLPISIFTISDARHSVQARLQWKVRTTSSDDAQQRETNLKRHMNAHCALSRPTRPQHDRVAISPSRVLFSLWRGTVEPLVRGPPVNCGCFGILWVVFFQCTRRAGGLDKARCAYPSAGTLQVGCL